jgi:hypothetical protein
MLIRKIADDLDVASGDIICLGHSVQGMSALFIGLTTQAGHVLAGAPPLGGTETAERALLASRESRARDRSANLVEYLTQAADADALPGAEYVDPMFVELARSARHVGTIDLFVSRKDLFWTSCEHFTALLADHPTLICRLIESRYAGHRRMASPYDEFLREQLEAIVNGRVREAADV